NFHTKGLHAVQPLTPNQKILFKEYKDKPEKHFFFSDSTGPGKTFCATYLALSDILGGSTDYHSLTIVRSAVSSRDLGFLPGDLDEKSAYYEDPYVDICNNLFSVNKSYENLKEIGKVKFITTSFLR